MAHLMKGCDFQLVADELRDMLRMEECSAQRRGEHFFYSSELIAAVNAFLQEPSQAAARRLQQAAPVLNPLFKACSPGGHLYEFRQMLT